MTEEVDFDNYRPDYFTEVVTKIAEHPDWEYRKDNQPIQEVGDEAAEFRSEAEFFLDHTETEGELWLHAPNLTNPISAVAGTLEQPLSAQEDREPYPDTFGEKISEAYRSIATDNEAEYLSPTSNTAKVLSLEVPFDYDSETLAESLDAASNASRQVQEMNDEVYQAIESRTTKF